MPKNKRILKEIAKRWAKAILDTPEAIIAFKDTGLTTEEIYYIDEIVQKIAENITDKGAGNSVDALVNEYFEFD